MTLEFNVSQLIFVCNRIQFNCFNCFVFHACELSHIYAWLAQTFWCNTASCCSNTATKTSNPKYSLDHLRLSPKTPENLRNDARELWK